MTTSQALARDAVGALKQDRASRLLSWGPSQTAALYGAIWIIGAAGLTAAHALTGGRYESAVALSAPAAQSNAPIIPPTPTKGAPMTVDPFPLFDDEQSGSNTTWVGADSNSGALRYRVTAPKDPNTEPVVGVGLTAPATALSGMAFSPPSEHAVVGSEKKISKKNARPGSTQSAHLPPAQGAVDRPPPPGLIYMNDPPAAAAASYVGLPNQLSAGYAKKTCTIVDRKPTVTTTTVAGNGTFKTSTEAETGMKSIRVCIEN